MQINLFKILFWDTVWCHLGCVWSPPRHHWASKWSCKKTWGPRWSRKAPRSENSHFRSARLQNHTNSIVFLTMGLNSRTFGACDLQVRFLFHFPWIPGPLECGRTGKVIGGFDTIKDSNVQKKTGSRPQIR